MTVGFTPEGLPRREGSPIPQVRDQPERQIFEIDVSAIKHFIGFRRYALTIIAVWVGVVLHHAVTSTRAGWIFVAIILLILAQLIVLAEYLAPARLALAVAAPIAGLMAVTAFTGTRDVLAAFALALGNLDTVTPAAIGQLLLLPWLWRATWHFFKSARGMWGAGRRGLALLLRPPSWRRANRWGATRAPLSRLAFREVGLIGLLGTLAIVTAPFVALPILFCTLATRHIRRYVALRAPKAADVISKNVSFALLLRRFRDDRARLPGSFLWSKNPIRLLSIEKESFEEWLARTAGPLVALANPLAPPDEPGAFRDVAGAEWQDRIQELVSRAQRLLVLYDGGGALEWELDAIESRGFLQKTIFVFPPTNPHREVMRWLNHAARFGVRTGLRNRTLATIVLPGSLIRICSDECQASDYTLAMRLIEARFDEWMTAC